MPRGGARVGAGRKSLAPGEKRKTVTVELYESDIEIIKQAEGNSFSAKTRTVINFYKENYLQKDEKESEN